MPQGMLSPKKYKWWYIRTKAALYKHLKARKALLKEPRPTDWTLLTRYLSNLAHGFYVQSLPDILASHVQNYTWTPTPQPGPFTMFPIHPVICWQKATFFSISPFTFCSP